ncbi:MAG: ribonuclease P protein component [Bacteroidota bacterium]
MSLIEDQSFPKVEHLKSRKQIDELFKGGKSFFVHPVKVFWNISKLNNATNIPVTIGVSASKRNFKKAVDRNRVKRLLRESYRLNKQDLFQACEAKQNQLQAFFIYVDKSQPSFENIQSKVKLCLKRLQKIVEDAA